MYEPTDIMISGGGVAGLTAAAAFGSAGFQVILVDPAAPITTEAADGADLRTTALLQPARKLLEDAGLWASLAPHAAPLQIMRIVDAGGSAQEPRQIKDFDAADVSDQPFGWNLPNWLLRREILARLAQLANVSFRPGLATTAILTRDSEALITLSNATRIKARLVIAADGRASPIRTALNIPVKTLRYGQKALTFAVSHKVPHQNISTEIHRSGGPFTLVPLPDRHGRPASAVVWMDLGPEIQRLAALATPDFEAEINARSCLLLGPLTLASKRAQWPIISQLAARMSGQRAALIAEAAHVTPPIGAQGLNMSLADLACLLDLARDTTDLGGTQILDAYHRRRHPDISARILGIDALNRAAMLGTPALRDLRAGTLNLLHSLPPLKRTLMQAGLGLH